MMLRQLGGGLLIAVLMVASANATVVFDDDFDTENGGIGLLNYFPFANWTVSNGSVDLIGNGFNDLYPGNGLYVDIDGTTGDAAVFTSNPLALAAGSYLLEFDLGNNPGGVNNMTVSLGVNYSEVFADADAGIGSYNSIVRSINVATAGSYSLVFDHTGGDNHGLIIDNVRLTYRAVPEPASVMALAIIAGMAAVCCRR